MDTIGNPRLLTDLVLAALDADDMAKAESILLAHDEAIRASVRHQEQENTPTATWRNLLAEQQLLISALTERRDSCANELRILNRSGRTLRAYRVEPPP